MFVKIVEKREIHPGEDPKGMYGGLPLEEWDDESEMVVECERVKFSRAPDRIMISCLVRRHTIETATGYDWDSLEYKTKGLAVFLMNDNGKTFDSMRWN